MFASFIPQFLNSPDQQINSSDWDHRNPDIRPAEKVSTSNRKPIVRIVTELRFKEHFQSNDTPAAEEKYSPRHNGIMSAFVMAEKLREVTVQQTHPDRQINKKYSSGNIFQKIPER